MSDRVRQVALLAVLCVVVEACHAPSAPWLPVGGRLATAGLPGDTAGRGQEAGNGNRARWPGEMARLHVVADGPFTALTQNGWFGEQRDTINGSGLTLVADSTAPRSPSSVLAFAYGSGFLGGNAPGVEFYRLPTPAEETFFGFWWKPSSPWQNHESSGVNKIALLFPETPGAGTVYVMMFFDGTQYTIQTETTFASDTRRLTPNVTATPVTLGEWHQIGLYVRYNKPQKRDGVVRWWVNGVLQGVYTDVQMPPDGGFIEYQIAPVWGGVGEFKTQPDHFWYDYAHISTR